MACPEKKWDKCPYPPKCPYWDEGEHRCYYVKPVKGMVQ